MAEYLRVFYLVGFFYGFARFEKFTASPIRGAGAICHAHGGSAMLVLSRKNDEAVVLGGSVGFERMIKITVVEIKKGRVVLGFEADADVPINRFEVWERICGEARQLILDSSTSCLSRATG